LELREVEGPATALKRQDRNAGRKAIRGLDRIIDVGAALADTRAWRGACPVAVLGREHLVDSPSRPAG